MSDILAVTYDDLVAVTTSDTIPQFASPAAGFMCDVAGTIKILTSRGTTITKTILAGVIYPIAIRQVFATGTTATGIAGVVATPYKATP